MVWPLSAVNAIYIYIYFLEKGESCHFIYIFLIFFPFLLIRGWLPMYKVIINQSPPRSVWMLRSRTMVSVVTTTPSWFFHLTRGMRELRTISLIYQPRLHCCKQQHGRTFHVKAAANASGGVVVGFFGGYTDVFPKACDSFEKLKGDNSVLAMRRMGDGKGRVSCWKMGTWRAKGAVFILRIHCG